MSEPCASAAGCLQECATLSFHPMVNDATVLISPADFEKFLLSLHRPVEWVRVANALTF